MKKTLGIAAILTALFGTTAFAASTGKADPYGVQPHEVRVLNKEPSAADIANICTNKAKYNGLTGSAMDEFVAKCKSDV